MRSIPHLCNEQAHERGAFAMQTAPVVACWSFSPWRSYLSPSCMHGFSWGCSCFGCCARAAAWYHCSFNRPLDFHLVKCESEMVLTVRAKVSSISWWSTSVLTQLVYICGWSMLQSWGRDSALLSLAIHKFADSGASILSAERERGNSSPMLRQEEWITFWHASLMHSQHWCVILGV